jgi:hypothetical protein
MFPEASFVQRLSLDVGRICTSGAQAGAVIGYARVAWTELGVNERLYCVGALNAARYINWARRRNRGIVRLGLDVKSPVLTGGGVCDINCYAIC